MMVRVVILLKLSVVNILLLSSVPPEFSLAFNPSHWGALRRGLKGRGPVYTHTPGLQPSTDEIRQWKSFPAFFFEGVRQFAKQRLLAQVLYTSETEGRTRLSSCTSSSLTSIATFKVRTVTPLPSSARVCLFPIVTHRQFCALVRAAAP
jgi:hypothetical protein